MATDKKQPCIGDGATMVFRSDRHAGTIIWHSTSARNGMPLQLIVQRDRATRTDKLGMSDAQEYAYVPDPTGPTYEYTLRCNGTYVRKAEPMRSGTRLWVGVRDEYFDFSF